MKAAKRMCSDIPQHSGVITVCKETYETFALGYDRKLLLIGKGRMDIFTFKNKGRGMERWVSR